MPSSAAAVLTALGLEEEEEILISRSRSTALQATRPHTSQGERGEPWAKNHQTKTEKEENRGLELKGQEPRKPQLEARASRIRCRLRNIAKMSCIMAESTLRRRDCSSNEGCRTDCSSDEGSDSGGAGHLPKQMATKD